MKIQLSHDLRLPSASWVPVRCINPACDEPVTYKGEFCRRCERQIQQTRHALRAKQTARMERTA